MTQAAAMAVDAVTALQALIQRCGLKDGESLLDLLVPAAALVTWPCNSPNAWARARIGCGIGLGR